MTNQCARLQCFPCYMVSKLCFSKPPYPKYAKIATSAISCAEILVWLESMSHCKLQKNIFIWEKSVVVFDI